MLIDKSRKLKGQILERTLNIEHILAVKNSPHF